MAFNFFRHLSTNKNLTTVMQKRFAVIIEHMDDNYELPHGEVKDILSILTVRGSPCSEQSIRNNANAIKGVVSVLRDGEIKKKELQIKAEKGNPAAKSALNILGLLPKELTWRKIQDANRALKNQDMVPIESKEKGTSPSLGDGNEKIDEEASPSEEHPLLQIAASVLRELDMLRKERESHKAELAQAREKHRQDLEQVRKAFQVLEAQHYSLLRRLESLRVSECGETNSVGSEKGWEVQKVVYGLPNTTGPDAFKQRLSVAYSQSFQRAFLWLHPDVKRQCAGAIQTLCEKGWDASRSSLQHKKLGKGNQYIREGMIVSRISKKYRFAWEAKNGSEVIIHHVGPHSEFWPTDS